MDKEKIKSNRLGRLAPCEFVNISRLFFRVSGNNNSPQLRSVELQIWPQPGVTAHDAHARFGARFHGSSFDRWHCCECPKIHGCQRSSWQVADLRELCVASWASVWLIMCKMCNCQALLFWFMGYVMKTGLWIPALLYELHWDTGRRGIMEKWLEVMCRMKIKTTNKRICRMQISQKLIFILCVKCEQITFIIVALFDLVMGQKNSVFLFINSISKNSDKL